MYRLNTLTTRSDGYQTKAINRSAIILEGSPAHFGTFARACARPARRTPCWRSWNWSDGRHTRYGAGGRGGGSFGSGAGLANPSVGAGPRPSWFAAGRRRGGGGGRGFCYAFRQGTCTDPACRFLHEKGGGNGEGTNEGAW